MREIAVFVVRCPLKKFEVRNNIFCTTGAAMDVKPEQVTNTTLFDYNVYGPLTETPMPGLGREKHGAILRGTEIQFVKPPAAPAAQGVAAGAANLHLKAGSPGANGAPLLPEAPQDHDGKPRRAGGPFGAYANTAE
jgi:hypothetical protein